MSGPGGRLPVFALVLGDDGLEPFYRDLPATRPTLLGTTVLDGRLVLQEYGPARGA